jgi:hypothetical protein
VKKELPAIFVLLVLTLHSTSVCGSEKTYEDGKLLSVNSPEVPLTIPPLVSSGSTVTFPLHLFYHFEVQQGDIVYIGYCQRRDYKAEWRVGDDVQFRLQKDKMYLKRQNGKEFKLEFLLEAKLGPDGKPVTVVSHKKQ